MVRRPSRRRPAPEPGEVEDPLAADKRTLAIGATAMVVFVLIGVVSAQLFVTGGCVPLGEPRAATAGTAGVDELLDGDARAELEDLLGVELTSAAVVAGDADRLVADATGGILAVGDTVTTLDADLAPTTEVAVPGVVVGDGPTLFDLALTNELTGQVDAFTPLDAATLDPGSCTDTTVVSEQFAFLLDAGRGQLLQLRIDEDGDLPRVQLRDVDGVVSTLALTLPAGPAGAFGDRVTGRTDGEAVVVARRVTADDPDAAIVIADAATGERRGELDRAAVADVVGRHGGVLDLDGPRDDELPLRIEVLAVAEDRAWLTVLADPADEELPSPTPLLVTLDLDAGTLTANGDLGGPVGAVAVADDGALALGVEVADLGRTSVVVIDPDGTFRGPVTGTPGPPRSLRWEASGPVLVTDGGLATLHPDETRRLEDAGTDVRDVLVDDDGRTLVLVRAVGRSAVLVGEGA